MVTDAEAPCAIILAAGVGRRLAEAGVAAKCLVRFGGETLLARHLRLLRQHGVRDITIVTGHAADAVVREAMQPGADGMVGPLPRCVMNPCFTEGSVLSLLAAEAVLRCGRPVVLMDADVLHDSRMLGRLISAKLADNLLQGSIVLVDRDLAPGDEPVKLCVREGQIVDLHKRPVDMGEWHGESVGFFRLAPGSATALATRAAEYATGDGRAAEYERPLRETMLAEPDGWAWADVTGLPWTEIDFPADLAKAMRLFPTLVD